MRGLGLTRAGRAKALSRALLLPALAALAILPSAARAGDVTLATSDTGDYAVRVTSYSEIPFQTVIRQQYDYSCGSAALATMLRFHYGVQTDEAEVFKAMYAVGDQARIQKLGFSLLDMKKYLASLGYEADGYRLSIEEMGQVGAPVIALVQINSYKHFVVVKGYIDGHILFGDPAQGLRMMPAAEFQKIWNGIAFVVHGGTQKDPIYNSAAEWRHWTDAHPLTAAVLVQPLAPMLRDLHILYQIRPNEILPNPFQP
jgi:predicted double-glycine peptidase